MVPRAQVGTRRLLLNDDQRRRLATGSNPALMAPLQAMDSSELGWKENEWLRAEWVVSSKNVVRGLFSNEDPNAVVAKETQFRKRIR